MTARTRPSLRMRLVVAYLGTTRTKRVLGDVDATEADRQRGRQQGAAPPSRRVRRTHDVTEHERDGLRWAEVVDRGRNPTSNIVYVHGGGYISPAVVQHWDLMAALASDNNARVVAPFYALAPAGTAATELPDMVDLHLRLTEESGGSPPTWAGDSAGGGLALATAMRLRDDGQPLPRHLLLFAPWLDVELLNPRISEVIETDPTLNLPGLRYAGKLWSGDLPPSSPQVSPGNGEPRGLPPMTVIVGTRDIFVADCRDFSARARVAGVDIVLRESPGGFHVYPAATFLPESREARRLVTERLNVEGDRA